MANDIDAVVACYEPDALLVLPDGAELRGHSEIRRFYEAGRAAFPRRTVRIVDQLDGTDGRAVFAWQAELFDESGAPFLMQGFNIVTVANGRFSELRAAYPAPRPKQENTTNKKS